MGNRTSSYQAKKLASRELLEKTPLSFIPKFDTTYQREWKRFCKVFVERVYGKGDVILKENEPCSSIFVIQQGQVDISFLRDGRSQFLCTKKEGDFFGINEFSILLDAKKSSKSQISARTKSDTCTILRLYSHALPAMNHFHDRIFLELALSYCTIDALQKLSWLSGLPTEHLGLLSHMLHFQPLDAGEELFSEGSLGREIYIVSKGHVKAVSYGNDGEEKMLGEFGEGEYFGETAFACNMPRTATIVSTERSLLLRLDKGDCDRFFGLFPINQEPWTNMVKQRTAQSFRKYQVPFFAGIPDDKYALLASLCTIERLSAGSVVYKEGDIGDTFYLVANGELEMSTKSSKDRTSEIVLSTIGPGKFFGEIALVRNTVRTATIITTSRCVLLTLRKAQFEQFFREAPEALVDFQVKLARYDIVLRHMIHHPLGCTYFEKHLQKEYSDENLLFWKECEKFRILGDQRLLKTKAREIYKRFIDDDAPEEVNLPETVKTPVVEAIQSCLGVKNVLSESVFERAQEEILQLMSSDSFQRFKQTDLFQQFLTETQDLETESNRSFSILSPTPKKTPPRKSVRKSSNSSNKRESFKFGTTPRKLSHPRKASTSFSNSRPQTSTLSPESNPANEKSARGHQRSLSTTYNFVRSRLSSG